MAEPIAEPSESSRKGLRAGYMLRMLLPFLATLALAGLLVFTIFFTLLEWQWIAFLSGILFAAVLSLISASWKAQWGMAQSAEQVAQMREQLAVEKVTHHHAGERLDRELALHQQDRERLASETEARRAAEQRARGAEDTLRRLERVPTAACLVDGESRCRFHTRTFAAWIGKHSSQIEGHAIEELFSGNSIETLRAALADALEGRTARAELSTNAQGATQMQLIADLVPHQDTTGQVSGILVTFRDSAAVRSPPRASDARQEGAATDLAAGVRVTDESGPAVYLRSFTEETTGWSDSQARIREAIDQDRFDLYAQDIVALRAGLQPARMLELLIRMRDEEEQHLPPGAFLPAAEHFGLMPEIDRWVVKKTVAACAGVETARRAELPLLCINVARPTLADRTFPEFVAGTLVQHALHGSLLCFEISDNDAIAANADAARFATEVKRLGCRVSLDGFGAGGVGFDHVKALPLDFLKIDGRITLAITRDPVAVAKVNAIGRVCRVIGVHTVAEMVESEDVRQKLVSLDVDYAQGFGIALPHPLGVLV